MDAGEKLTIYLADDDFDDRDLFMEALESTAIETEVSEFDNGVDLMDRLFSDSSLPDVIFLDLYMPIMDGFECLTDIRNFNKFDNIYIVAYSTIFRQREVNQLQEDGANQFFKKSSSFAELKKMLSKSLTAILNVKGKKKVEEAFIILA